MTFLKFITHQKKIHRFVKHNLNNLKSLSTTQKENSETDPVARIFYLKVSNQYKLTT